MFAKWECFPLTRQEVADLARVHGHDYMPLVSEDPAVQAHYEKCRLEGTDHKLAEMFAFGQPPACMTDNVFNEGRNGDQWGKGQEWMGNWYAQTARKNGVDIKGATYLHSLAAYPGDPRAWVRTRGDVQRVCEERGWGCQGAVNVKSRDPEQDPKGNVSVAPDIVEAETQRAIDADPGLAFRPREEVAEQVHEKLKPHWHDKKPRKSRTQIALEAAA